MARNSDDDVSFDPRSWTRRDGTGQPESAGETLDPTTWVSRSTSPRHTETAELPPTPAPPVDARSFPLAIGASALLLLGGGVAAYLSRAPTSVPVAAVGTPASITAALPATGPVDASRRTLVVAGPAAIASTLASAGIDPAIAGAVERAAALGAGAGDIRMVFDLVGPDDARRLTRLEATRADGSGAVLTARPDGGFARDARRAKLTTVVRVVRGEMDQTSFYNAAVTAGVTDSLINDIANAFSYDFNFAIDVHPGDIFEAAFEQQVNPNGDAVGPPTLIYVALSTAAKAKSLYRFLAPGDAQAGWYDGNGRSTVTALMRTPVDGARISSPFGMRFHPVLHFNKLHKGTDFAAPIGTPIYAAGSGTILWAAMKGANGNLTVLQHDNGWQTLYLHQSMFMAGIAPGARVSQGQKIGEIGTTGRSTGPHLHFELHVGGEPVDPMSVPTGRGRSLGGESLTAFRRERDRIDVSRSTPAG